MHDADNEIHTPQANMTKVNQYFLWHEVYETTGMMHAMRHIEMVIFIKRMAQIYLSCLRKRLKMAQGMNFILIDGWNMLRMDGKKENDLVLKNRI